METTIKEVTLHLKGYRFICPKGDFKFENWSKGLVVATANRHLEHHRFYDAEEARKKESRQTLRKQMQEVKQS